MRRNPHLINNTTNANAILQRGFNSRRRKRPTLALLIENSAGLGGYQSQVLAGVIEAAEEHDVNLLCFAGGSLKKAPFSPFEYQRNTIYNFWNQNLVDGLIINGTLGSFVDKKVFFEFITRYSPLPIVSLAVPIQDFPVVDTDNVKGMRELVSHLIIDHHRRRIAFITGPRGNEDARIRREVYEKLLKEHDLPIEPDLVVTGDFTPNAGRRAVRLLIDKRKMEFDALVAANDNMALGALEALKERGKNVPDDISLVGFDDIEWARGVTPPLTTVRQRRLEQGKKAVEILLNLLDGIPQKGVTLETRLVIRESCGCKVQRRLHSEDGGRMLELQNERFDEIITTKRDWVIERMLNASGMFSETHYIDHMMQLLKTFADEIVHRHSGAFIRNLEEILHQGTKGGNDLKEWHKALSELHHIISICSGNKEMLVHAENLCLEGLFIVGEMAQWEQAHRRFLVEQEVALLSQINEALITPIVEEELMDVIAHEVPKSQIPRLYICRYKLNASTTKNKKPVLPLTSELVLAYEKGRRVKLDPKLSTFPSHQLLPKGMLNRRGGSRMIVEPLYFREEKLGYALFEVGPKDGLVYETLRGQISSALKKTELFCQVDEMRKEQESLSERLQRVAYDAIDLAVKPAIGDLVDAALKTMSKELLANSALYRRKPDGDDVAILLGSYPKDFVSQLKQECRVGESPIEEDSLGNGTGQLMFHFYNRQRKKDEGFVLVQRSGTLEDPVQPFIKSDETCLSLLATAIGYCLQTLGAEINKEA
jgi:DNA-binding LacI/PurR family transcriptional regulator